MTGNIGFLFTRDFYRRGLVDEPTLCENEIRDKLSTILTQRVPDLDNGFFVKGTQGFWLKTLYSGLLLGMGLIHGQGGSDEDVKFPTLIRNMTRKIDQIANHCGGFVDSGEVKRIQGLAQGVRMVYHELHTASFERFSNRLGRPMDLSGMMGCMRFRGALSPFVPWVRAAQKLHIGKNTTFGLGQYEVTFT